MALIAMKKGQILKLLKKELPGVRTNIPLKNHTTFKIGGPAGYFFEAGDSGKIALGASGRRVALEPTRAPARPRLAATKP